MYWLFVLFRIYIYRDRETEVNKRNFLIGVVRCETKIIAEKNKTLKTETSFVPGNNTISLIADSLIYGRMKRHRKSPHPSLLFLREL